MTPALAGVDLIPAMAKAHDATVLTQYLQYGFSHLLMDVFGRFNSVRSVMV